MYIYTVMFRCVCIRVHVYKHEVWSSYALYKVSDMFGSIPVKLSLKEAELFLDSITRLSDRELKRLTSARLMRTLQPKTSR